MLLAAVCAGLQAFTFQGGRVPAAVHGALLCVTVVAVLLVGAMHPKTKWNGGEGTLSSEHVVGAPIWARGLGVLTVLNLVVIGIRWNTAGLASSVDVTDESLAAHPIIGEGVLALLLFFAWLGVLIGFAAEKARRELFVAY